MKRITCSVLIALAASALYINSSDSVQANEGVPISDRGSSMRRKTLSG